MEHISGVYVLQSAQNLVNEISDVVIAKALSFKQFMEICFHQCLYNVNIFHVFIGSWAQNIQDINYLEREGGERRGERGEEMKENRAYTNASIIFKYSRFTFS